MCGILGIFQRKGGVSGLGNGDLLRLRHRGPDGDGLYHDDYVSLGHVRLSIIDLTPGGAQPMKYADGRFIITYNGEIYNYLEIKDELSAHGAIFRSTSDTEVVLAAYAQWGVDCVTHLRGMFAFALWDKQNKLLFLARDRCGEKPLIYYQDNDRFIFASEFKGLVPILPRLPEIDPASVDMYLHYQYTPEPYTLLKGVKKLPAGHFLVMSPDKWIAEPARYWNIEETPQLPSNILGNDSTLVCIRQSLEEATRLCLRSDVPVGIALSGGIDSGAIASLAQKHYPEPMHAIAVGYPGRPHYDERGEASTLAEKLGMVFHEVELPVDAFIDFFPRLVEILDEPIADIAAFGHYAVSKAAADLGIKVLLTGIGGDEVFWGYQWTADSVIINMKNSLVNKLWLGPWKRLFNYMLGYQNLINHKTPENQLFFFPKEADFWPAFGLKSSVYGDAMEMIHRENPFRPTDIGLRKGDQIPFAIIRMLFDTWLVSNCLNLGDRVSMAVGVETRLPFLDQKLIETVMTLRHRTPDYKLGQKAWLRGALKGILPDDVLARSKRGFQPPVMEWMSGVVIKYSDRLRSGYLESAHIIDSNKLLTLLRGESLTTWTSLFFAYKLVLLEIWLGQMFRQNSNSLTCYNAKA